MGKAFRKTGIDIMGDAPWGTHLCQFYQTKKDLIDILVPYFKAGLENNEFCMWITSEPLKVEGAKAALKKVVKNLDHFIKKGQIEILDYSEWYTKSGKFDANNVLQGWVEKENQALKRGYDGLRLSGNTFWLAKRDWRNFTDYEEEVNNLIGKYRMIAICTYSLGKCGASEVIDVVSNHQFALVRREGEWVIIESSERKRVEEVLQSSEANLRKIIGKNADGMVVVDRDGLMCFVNPGAEALFGCKAQELIDNFFGFPIVVGETSEIEIIRRDGGGIRVAEMRVVEMEWEEKNAYLASVHDITERKRAEEALRKSEEKYRTILETIEEGYFEVDIAGNFTFFNDSLPRLLGYSRDEMMGMNNRRYTDKENAQKLYQAFNRVYRTGEPTKEFDWEIIRKDGTKRYIETSVSLIKNSSGQPIGFRGIVRDITERKQTEEALRESEKKYRTLVTQSPDGIFVVDLQGTFLAVNKAMCERLKYSEEEFLSMKIWDIVPEKYVDLHKKRLADILRGEGPNEAAEYVVRGKDEKMHYIEVLSSPYFRENEVIGLQGIARDITERKRMEGTLKESEEKYRLLVENANEAIFVIQDGMLRFFNIKNIELIGYSKEELTSTPFINFVHPDDREVTLGRYLKRIGGEELPGVNVFRMIDKAGNIKWAEVNSVLISWEGRPAILNFVNDTTERKQAEEALKASEERFRLAAESSSDLIYEWDIKERVDWFGKIDEMLGYYPNEFPRTFEAWVNSVHPEDRDRVVAAVKNHSEKNEPYNTEYRIRKKDGTYNNWWVRGTAVRDEKGNPYRWVGAVTDVTERKRAEQALRESEEKYRVLVETSPDAITLFDLNLNILMVNRPALTLYGYGYDRQEEIVGKSVLDYLVPEEFARARENIERVLETGRVETVEYTLRKNDGTLFPAELRASLILDNQKKPNAILCVSRDISERKRAEEEMVAVQEQFRQSQKMEAIGQLAGGIAHDFNNLLTIIKGYSQMTSMELKEGDPLKERIEQIKRAADRAADLIRQLLVFSRRQTLEFKVIDLNTALRNFEKMLRRVIGEDIELVIHLPEDLGGVKTDPGQIEQVIMNLAVNAKDAMPSGGKLTIETANVELDEEYARKHVAVKTGGYVMLAVSDTGMGMTPEVRDRVFEPFFTTKEEGKGTGLGLSTVYGIVKQSGGNIWVYSELGKGTTFKIYFPRVDEPLDEISEKVTVRKGLLRGSETILVVEDEEEVRKLVVWGLEGQGYRVLDAPQGLDAFLIGEENQGRIHLLVTDVVMPKMSGRDLAERLASIRPGIKVLYMSGYTERAIAHKGILDKGIYFIQKPFTVEELARKVREVLDK